MTNKQHRADMLLALCRLLHLLYELLGSEGEPFVLWPQQNTGPAREQLPTYTDSGAALAHMLAQHDWQSARRWAVPSHYKAVLSWPECIWSAFLHMLPSLEAAVQLFSVPCMKGTELQSVCVPAATHSGRRILGFTCNLHDSTVSVYEGM